MARRSDAQPSGLSRERILEAALEVSAREGVDALSMRRLAQELDVWPMSVYRYFQDKDALLDAMAAGLVGQIPEPSHDGPWRERMQALLGSTARELAAAPGLAARLPRAFLTDGAPRLTEAGMAILLDAGFAPAEAASAWLALWSYTFGFATFGIESPLAVRAAVAGLDEADYPALAEAGRALVDALSSASEFGPGLDRLLDGLEARAAST
jgi:AcrR family transcriptional regulator